MLLTLLVLLLAVLFEVPSPSGATGTVSRQETDRPQGTVRVAYPEEPGAWYPSLRDEPAAIDLAALWGLPLYRIDDAGQLRPALAEAATVLPGGPGERWRVQIRLAEGEWSDGEAVEAEDVVATVDALRDVRGEELAPLVGVEVVDARTLRLVFDRPYARWPYLLAGGFSVLPAHVLRGDGLDAYETGVPVSGGPFRLVEHEDGLRAVFGAHGRGVLGAPRLERVEVYFTGSYETALGLLRDRRVDVVLGHLALNPVERARRLDVVEAAANVGGTWAVLQWRPEGGLGDEPDTRRVVREAIDLSRFVEGLLSPHGAELTSTIPGVAGPWETPQEVDPGLLEGESLRLLVPGDEEAPSLSARAFEPSLSGRGAEVEIARVDAQLLYELASEEGDGAVLPRRDLPVPSLIGQRPGGTPEFIEALVRADAAAMGTDAKETGQELLHGDALLLPLYQVAVAHAWHEALEGIRPSSWPGVGMWDVRRWHWGEDGPPAQRAPVRTGS